MRRCLHLLVLALLVWACAPTNSTGALPLEVLVVLDSVGQSLSLIPVDSTRVAQTIPLGPLGFVPRFVAARNNMAVVAGSDPATEVGGLAIVNLSTRTIREVTLPIGTVADVVMSDDNTAFVAQLSSGLVSRVMLSTGEVLPIQATGGPRGLAATRGKVFAAMSNRQTCQADPLGCTRGPSWLLQVEPGLPRDSIPVSGVGNAGPIAVGADGIIYMLVPGDNNVGSEGRLDLVDPVRNSELASFARIGPVLPGWITSDGAERIFLASEPGGLMVFNIRERRLTLPFGSGIPLTFPTDLATDALGRIYAFERGGCSAGDPGVIRVYKSNLIEGQSLHAANCPVAGAIAEVPADDLYGS